MINFLRKMARSLAVSLGVFEWYFLNSLRKYGALVDDGWFRSFLERKPVDRHGNPLPWLTYPAIDFLCQRVTPEMNVFEYGCGNGTLWWASRVAFVAAVEHDYTWYEQISTKIPANVCLSFVELSYGGDYAKSVSKGGEHFDVIVIDGRDRVNSVKHSIEALSESGVIVWDDSDRPEYEEGYRFLAEMGFRKLPFRGMTPLVNYKSETSIFYRSGNCFGI